MSYNWIMQRYTTVQAAKLLGVGRDSLYRWMRTGKIKGTQLVQLGGVRVRFWTERDIERTKQFLKENYCKGRGRKPKREGGGSEERT